MVAAGACLTVLTMLVMYLAGSVWANPAPTAGRATQLETPAVTSLPDIPTTILANISFSEGAGEVITYTIPLPTVTGLPLPKPSVALPDGGYLAVPNPNPVSVQVTATPLATSMPAATAEVTTPSNSEITATPAPLAIPTLPPVTAQPARLTITSIGISDFEIRPVGLEMVKLPSGKRTQQWQALDYSIGYHTSPPGQICKWGLTVLNGHNWWKYKPGVFVNLHKAKLGDIIEATDSQGASCSYRIEEVKEYGPLETSWLGDTSQIYDGASSHLVLYTCSQDFQDRIVVRASQVKS